MQENIEVILINVPKELVDIILSFELKITNDNANNSHFYDINKKEDLEFNQVGSFQDLFTCSNTGYIHLNQIKLGTLINDVMVIVSFDESHGDIVFNFSERELFQENKIENKKKCLEIVKYLVQLMNKYSINQIRLGYESAYDEDCILAYITNSKVDIDSVVRDIMIKL